MLSFNIFDLTYLSILSILAYYDIKNNKNVPDLLVWLMYIIGIYEAIVKSMMLYLVAYAIIGYLLYRLGVFGDAEIWILPVLAIHLGIRFIDLILISSVLTIAASFAISFAIFILIVMFINPLISTALAYLGFFIWRDKLRLYQIRKVSIDLIGEVTLEGKVINKEYVEKNLGKSVVIKRTIPYLPILLVSLILVLGTEISFLKLLLPQTEIYHLLS